MEPKRIYSHSRTYCMYFEYAFYIIIVTVIHYIFVVLLLCQFNKLNISFSTLFCLACLFNINIYADGVHGTFILKCCQALIYKYPVQSYDNIGPASSHLLYRWCMMWGENSSTLRISKFRSEGRKGQVNFNNSSGGLTLRMIRKN